MEPEERVESDKIVMESESEEEKWTVVLDRKESDEEEESDSTGRVGLGKRCNKHVGSVLKKPFRPKVIMSMSSGSRKDEKRFERPWKKDRRHWTLEWWGH